MRVYDPQFERLGALAERYFADDPNTCLVKLRQFGELLAQETTARTGLYTSAEESQSDLLRRLKAERAVPPPAMDLFHQIRIPGNKATHSLAGDRAIALTTLKIARELAVWFHRTFAKQSGFKPGPFVPPSPPADAETSLREELARLQAALGAQRTQEEQARAEAEEARRARESAEDRARREAEERIVWEKLAQEAEEAKLALAAQLASLQSAAAQAPAQQKTAILQEAEEAARAINLDEAATRAIIDRQLRDRGWEADSPTLRYAKGARPVNGRAMAIAEWPTASGPADYALFIGTQLIATVEAKRRNKNVSACIDQAERYSKGFKFETSARPIGGPWGDYRAPFTFSANGRPYLKQIETESGIWFRDTRRDTNRRRALVDWFTPDGLKAEFETDRVAAQEALKTQPFAFGFPLRLYQRAAIEKVEEELGTDKREMLVAMATGTGKTKLAIALLYRLLSAKRFRRVCFVVDRNALGGQTAGEFQTTKVVGPRAFADIFDLKGLETATPEAETKVHICTIQGLVMRTLFAANPADVPPIDQYDLIVVDECHRGYLLDRELSDAELSFRSEEDYISKYRRVLDYFDAVKIGLTATPALHTAQIFGHPIYTYSYREAVIDGFLIDHEPPVRIETALAQAGIKWNAGEDIELLDTSTGQIGTVARLGVRRPIGYFRVCSLAEGGCVAWMLRLVKIGAEGEGPCTDVMEINRPGDLVDIANLGLTLAEAKLLLAGVQREIVAAQARDHAVRRPDCLRCDGVCRVKDYRDHAVSTLFGPVTLRLPRFRCAACGGIEAGLAWPAHCRSTPELDRLQAHLSALMTYRTAADVLAQMFPVDAGTHHETLRRYTLKVGEALGECATIRPDTAASAIVVTLDATFIRSCAEGERHLEVRVGNVETAFGGRQVFGAVAKSSTPIAELIRRRLDAVGRGGDTALTAFTDGCPGLRRILADAGVTTPPMLDWFRAT